MKWRAAADRAVAPLGLTQAQFSLLASLYGLSRAGLRPSQRELSEYCGLEPIFVSKLARTLESAGLIRRADHPADSRAVQLTLTEQGTDVAERAIARIRELQEELTAPLGGAGSVRTRELKAALAALLGHAAAESDSHSQNDPTDQSDPNRSETMVQTPALTGQDIGAAANATRAVLNVLLDREDTTFPEWVALRSLTQRGPGLTPNDFRRFLATGLAVEPAAIPDLLTRLESKGLIRQNAGGFVEMAPAGESLYDRLSGPLAEITAQLYSDLDPDDLAAAQRVLGAVTERAKALRSQL